MQRKYFLDTHKALITKYQRLSQSTSVAILQREIADKTVTNHVYSMKYIHGLMIRASSISEVAGSSL